MDKSLWFQSDVLVATVVNPNPNRNLLVAIRNKYT